jgi:hypothetical protein
MALVKLKNGNVVEVFKPTFEACPRGGGFVYRIPLDEIDEFPYEPVAKVEKLRCAIEDWTVFDAYADREDRWNGWLVPYFEIDVARKVVEETVANGGIAVYDEANDRFLVRLDARGPDDFSVPEANALDPENEEVEVYKGFDLETVDGPKHVYSVGGMSWIWSEVEDEEEREDEEVTPCGS